MKTSIAHNGSKKALTLKKKVVSNLFRPGKLYESTILTVTGTDALLF